MDDDTPTFITCCFCKLPAGRHGNNPFPLDKTQGAKCCDQCNLYRVVPARIEEHRHIQFLNYCKTQPEGVSKDRADDIMCQYMTHNDPNHTFTKAWDVVKDFVTTQ